LRFSTGTACTARPAFIRPRTLRARFGVDKLRNAVHATDLPEDGVLEAEYLFQILKAAGPK
jgi:nucleoside diphosphate kinase